MTVVRVDDGQVWTEDSVAIAQPPTGRQLRDGYWHFGVGDECFAEFRHNKKRVEVY